MGTVPSDDGLVVRAESVERDDEPAEQRGELEDHEGAGLRDAFVDAFNSRDLDGVLALVDEEVDCPDVAGDGVAVLAEELESIWERSPGAVLTRGRLADGQPCAVAWLPDEDGCWSRAALVCFDHADGLVTLLAVPDDADALERAETAEPVGDELDEWLDWAEWDRGEESVTRPREDAGG